MRTNATETTAAEPVDGFQHGSQPPFRGFGTKPIRPLCGYSGNIVGYDGAYRLWLDCMDGGEDSWRRCGR